MTLSLLALILLAALVLTLISPVLRLVLQAVALVVPLVLLVLFLLDLTHGAPLTIRFVNWLIVEFVQLYNGVRASRGIRYPVRVAAGGCRRTTCPGWGAG